MTTATASLRSWQVAVWADRRRRRRRTLVTQDFGDIHFDNDRMLITLAFVPEGTEIPKPPRARASSTS